jgi:hypothetical protein
MSWVLNFRKAATNSIGHFTDTKKHSINTVQERQYAQLNKALIASNTYFQTSSQRKGQEEALTSFRECCERKSLLQGVYDAVVDLLKRWHHFLG